MKLTKPLNRSALLLVLMIIASCSFLHAQSSELGLRIDQLSYGATQRTIAYPSGDVTAPANFANLNLGLFYQMNKVSHYLRFGAGVMRYNLSSERTNEGIPEDFSSNETSYWGNNLTFEAGKTWELLKVFRVQLGFETSLKQEWATLDRRSNPILSPTSNDVVIGYEIEESSPGGKTSLFGKAVLRADARVGKRFHFGAGIMYGGGLNFQSTAYRITTTQVDLQNNQIAQESDAITRKGFSLNRTGLASPFINISYTLGNNNN